MRLKNLTGRVIATTAFVLVAGIASFGQALGNFEVVGNVGVVGGIGSHGYFGGSIGAPVTDSLILSGDLSYIPLGGASVSVFGTTTSSSAQAINFNGNLQYQFRPTRGVVPYSGAGLGFLRSSFESSRSIPGQGTFKVSGHSTDTYFNFGGGLRYYVKQRWGFRPEFMFFAGSDTFVRFGGGIFYQFGE